MHRRVTLLAPGLAGPGIRRVAPDRPAWLSVPVEGLRADLARYLEESLEHLPKGIDQERSQTLAFRRVLQTAVLHVQSAGREEANVGDILAAILHQIVRIGTGRMRPKRRLGVVLLVLGGIYMA